MNSRQGYSGRGEETLEITLLLSMGRLFQLIYIYNTDHCTHMFYQSLLTLRPR